MEYLVMVGDFILENDWAFKGLCAVLTYLAMRITLRLFPTIQEETIASLIEKFVKFLLSKIPDYRKIKDESGATKIVNVAKKPEVK